MQHIEEHILELYLLGDEKALQRRGEIEAHLSECHGCRAMADRIKSFYATAEEEFEKQPEAQLRPGKSLVRKRTDISPFYEVDAGPIAQRPVTRLQRFQYFARRHPVVAGVGSFGFLAGLALLASTTILSPPKDENPVRLQNLDNEQTLLIFNSSSEKLWSLHHTNAATPTTDWNQLAQLIDLDNDGRNELVTTLRLLEDAQESNPVLRVFDYKKSLLYGKKDFSQPFGYLDRTYSPDFGASALLTGSPLRMQPPEIIVLAKNPRSPCYIARLDAKTSTIGEYWHFGWLYGFSFIDTDGDSLQEIVAWGENNTEDSTGREYSAIVVLDPRKIVGKGKSLLSPGFDMPFASAELCYVRLPYTDVNRVRHSHSQILQMRQHSDGTLWFTMSDSRLKGDFAFDFIFSSSMQLLDVRSTTWTNETYASLVGKGELKGQIDDAYLQNLKDGVRYWDGVEWRKEVVKVKPTTVATK
jgi:hypothetical protein